jgi:hypothetical protein
MTNKQMAEVLFNKYVEQHDLGIKLDDNDYHIHRHGDVVFLTIEDNGFELVIVGIFSYGPRGESKLYDAVWFSSEDPHPTKFKKLNV